PLRDRIYSILDQFYKELPTEEEQSEGDKIWRIALHRMDARHFKAEESKEPGKVILTPSEPRTLITAIFMRLQLPFFLAWSC
ncbi:MAG: hypothetical protein V1811_01510, partial [Candidatus Micrarchaeota archaeon]